MSWASTRLALTRCAPPPRCAPPRFVITPELDCSLATEAEAARRAVRAAELAQRDASCTVQRRVARHQLVVPLQQNSTGIVTRAAASVRLSWPTRPKTETVILRSAAASGIPIALPSETPQNPTGWSAPT